MALTPKQQRFAEEYLVDLNGTQAAIRAGYSAKTAHVQGPRLLGNVAVAAAVAAGQAKRATRTGITADRVLEALEQLAFADPRELTEIRVYPCGRCYEEDPDQRRIDAPPDPTCTCCYGNGDARVVLKDTRHLPPAAARLFAGAKVEKGSLQILMHSQERALELLGKHLKLFSDRLELTTTTSLADRLAKYRQRKP